MEINILWLYHNLLNANADIGNINTLKYRCEKRNIKLNIYKYVINDDIPDIPMDIVYTGSSNDKKLFIALEDLRKNEEKIKDVIQKSKLFFIQGDGAILFGKNIYRDEKIIYTGLGIIEKDFEKNDEKPYSTIMKISERNIEIVGFKNNRYKIKSSDNFLGKITKKDVILFDGYMDKNVIYSGIAGPILPRNPEFSDYLIKSVLEKKYNEKIEISNLNDTIEYMAKDELIREIS